MAWDTKSRRLERRETQGTHGLVVKEAQATKRQLTARICFLLNRGKGAIPHLSPTTDPPTIVEGVPVSFSFPFPLPFPFPFPFGCNEATVTAPWSARTVRPRSCASEMPLLYCWGTFAVLDREDEANGAERERGAAREGGRGRAVVAVVADDEDAFGVALRKAGTGVSTFVNPYEESR